ncbi:MAG: hypothetical protein MJY73_07170 [Bacteroidales bacterium]|nr:hypothetical protein [Bacteroidales bacterium]
MKAVMMMGKVGGRASMLFALALAFASCAAVEEIPYEEGPLDTMCHVVLSASFEEQAETKTVLNEDLSVSFKETDEITVFSGTESATFSIASISEDGLTARFEGVITPSETYYAIYPKDESAAITADGVVTTTLPTVQTATASSFGDGANLSIAKSENGSLQFRNVGAIASLSVANEGIASVTLESDTVLSGPAAISLVDGTPQIAVVEAASSVTLTGGLESGKKYYFVVYPGTHANGLKLTFTDADGNRAKLANPKTCEFKPNDNVFLGNITIADDKWIGPAVGYLTSSTIGIYDTELELVDYAFDKYADQLVKVVDTARSFRMQNLNQVKYIEIYDVPATYTVGDSFSVRVLQNYVEALDENYYETVTVEKVEDGLAWLKGNSGKGYIIKQ